MLEWMAKAMIAQTERYVTINGQSLVADYGDVEAEVAAVRTGAGVMDRGAWGRVQLTGADRLPFLQRMSTNDFSQLPLGLGKPTVFPDARGRMLERALAYGWEEETLLVGSLGAHKRLAGWLRQYIFFRDKVAVADLTADTGMLTVYGPQAVAVVRAVLGEAETEFLDEEFPRRYQFMPVPEAETLVAGADPLAGQALNLMVEPDRVPDLWARLTAAGAAPIGYTAYDRLRIEAGWPEYGHEITDAYNPLEAGLLSAVSFTKGCYIGQEVIARLDTYQKLKQHLMGLRFHQPAVHAAPGTALELDGRAVGVLTSAAPAPDGAVGLGYVRVSCAVAGATVTVTTPDGCAAAELTDLPGRWQRPYGME